MVAPHGTSAGATAPPRCRGPVVRNAGDGVCTSYIQDEAAGVPGGGMTLACALHACPRPASAASEVAARCGAPRTRMLPPPPSPPPPPPPPHPPLPRPAELFRGSMTDCPAEWGVPGYASWGQSRPAPRTHARTHASRDACCVAADPFIVLPAALFPSSRCPLPRGSLGYVCVG